MAISVDCEWQWGQWEQCNKPCGEGKQTRKKNITKPAGTGTCDTPSVDERSCFEKQCIGKACLIQNNELTFKLSMTIFLIPNHNS